MCATPKCLPLWRRVVLILVCLLVAAALGLPLLQRPHRHPPGMRCLNNLKQVGLALIMYAGDHGGAYPPDLYVLIPDYLANYPEVFRCRGTDTRMPARFAGRETFVCDYWYRGGGSCPAQGAPPTPLVMDYVSNHGEAGGGVVFSDGHGEWRKGRDWYRGIGDGRPPTRESAITAPPTGP